MLESDLIFQAEDVRRIDREGLAVLFHDEGLLDAHVVTGGIEPDDAGFLYRFGVGQRAAVQDGNFEVVELDNCVVDAQSVESREQMLHRGNPDAVAHQGRGIGDALHRTDVRPKLEVIEIHAPKHDTLSGGGWQKTHGGGLPGVKADSAELDRGSKGLFSHPWRCCNYESQIHRFRMNDLRTQSAERACTFVHSCGL